MSQKANEDDGSAAHKRRAAPLPNIVRVRKHSSTPIESDTTATTGTNGTPDKSTKTSNRNLAQGQQTNVVHTTTSYFSVAKLNDRD